jgi:hypothetical protein
VYKIWKVLLQLEIKCGQLVHGASMRSEKSVSTKKVDCYNTQSYARTSRMHSIRCKKYQCTLQSNVNNGKKIHAKKRVRNQGIYRAKILVQNVYSSQKLHVVYSQSREQFTYEFFAARTRCTSDKCIYSGQKLHTSVTIRTWKI